MAAAKRQEEDAAATAAVAEAKRKEMQQAAAAVNHNFPYVFDYGPSVSMFVCVLECCVRVCKVNKRPRWRAVGQCGIGRRGIGRCGVGRRSIGWCDIGRRSIGRRRRLLVKLPPQLSDHMLDALDFKKKKSDRNSFMFFELSC